MLREKGGPLSVIRRQLETQLIVQYLGSWVSLARDYGTRNRLTTATPQIKPSLFQRQSNTAAIQRRQQGLNAHTLHKSHGSPVWII